MDLAKVCSCFLIPCVIQFCEGYSWGWACLLSFMIAPSIHFITARFALQICWLINLDHILPSFSAFLDVSIFQLVYLEAAFWKSSKPLISCAGYNCRPG